MCDSGICLTFVIMKIESPYTVGPVRSQLIRSLSDVYGELEARAMTELMFDDLKGWSRVDLIMNDGFTLSDYIIGKLEDYATRILEGEPVQYVTGRARFYGLDLKVTPDVLIPRPETEELVDMIVDQNKTSDLRVLDVGTGSGAIAIALARNLKFSEVTAIDVSKEALEIAQENARMRHAPVRFIEKDIFSWTPVQDSYDIIVSNPPYIAQKEMSSMERNVLDHEPHLALFVPDDDPLRFYRRIAEIGRNALVAGGKLYFEINPIYADGLSELLSRLGYEDVTIKKDMQGLQRFATAVKQK